MPKIIYKIIENSSGFACAVAHNEFANKFDFFIIFEKTTEKLNCFELRSALSKITNFIQKLTFNLLYLRFNPVNSA